MLYPAVGYPSYAMGAMLAGLPGGPRARRRATGASTSRAIDPDDAARALCLWVNTPGNPAGGLDDLGAVAAWGRRHDVPVFSDECYVEFTWDGPPRIDPGAGSTGVVAVHSLSKRSNLAGVRVGFYAGDPELVALPRGGAQARRVHGAGPGAGGRGRRPRRRRHVDEQRDRYRAPPASWCSAVLGRPRGRRAALPEGGFYLWVPAPDGDALGADAAGSPSEVGALVSPGEFYGEAGDRLRPHRRGAARRARSTASPTAPGWRRDGAGGSVVTTVDVDLLAAHRRAGGRSRR